MTYRTYSGPRGCETIAPLDKDRLLYKEFDTLDSALAWARHVNAGGRVALLIAPERLLGKDGADIRSDLYAVGVILYELLTGIRPFHDDDAYTTVKRRRIERAALRSMPERRVRDSGFC